MACAGIAGDVSLDHGTGVAAASRFSSRTEQLAHYCSALQCVDNLVERRPAHTWLCRILGLTHFLSLRANIRVLGTSTRYDRGRPGDLDVWFADAGLQRLHVVVAVSQRRVYVSNSASHRQSQNACRDWRRDDDLVAGERPTVGSTAIDSGLVDVMDMGRSAKIWNLSEVAHGVGMCDCLVAQLLHLHPSYAFHDDCFGGDSVDSVFRISKTRRQQDIQRFLCQVCSRIRSGHSVGQHYLRADAKGSA